MRRLRRAPGVSLLLSLSAMMAACQSGSSVNAPALSNTADDVPLIGVTQPALHLQESGLVAGTAAMGVYRLDIVEGVASLAPAWRSASLTGAKFETDLTAAMSGEILTRCPDCFRVTGVRPTGPSRIAVEFQLRHPIPAPDGVSPTGAVLNRNDLHVTNVRLVALVDGTTEMFPGTRRVIVNMDQVTNADGYTKVEPVVALDPIYAADVFPFITMGDALATNNGQGNFLPGIGPGTGWEAVLSGNPETTSAYPKGFNVLPQGGTVIDELEFDLSQGATGNFTTNLVILASYIGAADGRDTRLTSRYFMPEGAIQQSPNVQISFTQVPGVDVGSPGELTIRAVDFQQGASITPDPLQALNDKDYSKVWADGRIEFVEPTLGEFIGNVNNFLGAAPQPGAFNRDVVAAASGTGSYASPKTLTVPFTNVNGYSGTLRVGCYVNDSRRNAPILDVAAAGANPLNPNVFESMTGLQKDLNVFNGPSVVSASPLLITYQFAKVDLSGEPPVPQGVFIPDTPARANPGMTNDFFRNGITASGNNIYAIWHWQGNDDSALFVARSADGGTTWGAPVKVAGDAIAGTEFEGRGFSITTGPGGVPVLVGVDSDEDVVCLVGTNSGTNLTTWPTGVANRIEVLARGDGRNFTVSAAALVNDPSKIAIGMNRRETVPATSNEVQYYLVEGVGSATLTKRKATEANGGVIDNGPDAGQSRFDVDVQTDGTGRVHFLWKDNGDSAIEYRTVLGAVVSPIESPFPGKLLSGTTRPNLAVDPVTGQPFVVIDFNSATVIDDGELTDRDVFISTKTGASWGTAVQVNEDALDLDEKEAEVAILPLSGGGFQVGICYEADLGANARRIFAATIDSSLAPGSIVRSQLTPDPTSGQDRLDPKIISNADGQAVVIWEAKKDGPAGQSAVW